MRNYSTIRARTQIVLIPLILIALSAHFVADTQGQQTNLKVKVSPITLSAGSTNNITVLIDNSFENIYDVDVRISFVPTQIGTTLPTVLGSSNWKFRTLEYGKNIAIEIPISVPEESAGKGYSANVVLIYKRLGYISPISETHVLGFYAKGIIKMEMFDFIIEPSPAIRGSIISVSATLLNRGNVAARFATAILIPSSIFALGPESSSYLGEIEPNSPTPFTLEATVNSSVHEGSYRMKIRVEYQDQESGSHTLEEEVSAYIVEAVVQPPKSASQQIVEVIYNRLTYVSLAVAATIIAVVLFLKRRCSNEESET